MAGWGGLAEVGVGPPAWQWMLQCVRYTIMMFADLIRELRRAGWTLDRVAGSHPVFKHPERPGIVVVPHPKKDLGTALVRAIRRQTGL